MPNLVSRIMTICKDIDGQNHDFIVNDPKIQRLTSRALKLNEEKRLEEIDDVLEEVAAFAKAFDARQIAFSNATVGSVIGFRLNNKPNVYPVRIVSKSRFTISIQSDEPNEGLPFPQHVPHIMQWSTRLNRYYSGMGWAVAVPREES